MKLSILICIIWGTLNATGQSIPSSCNAPDSILMKYKDDADRLALRKIYHDSLVYKDSIKIPQSYSDTVLKALIAVYNATTLAARDTVVGNFNIHTWSDIYMKSFSVSADSNLLWMQQLKHRNIPTGYQSIDNLLNTYNLSVFNYSYPTYPSAIPYHTVYFKTDSNRNLTPLRKLFDTIQGVHYTDNGFSIGDGSNISDSVYIDHVVLIYSFAWGDCPSGCTGRRYWKFSIDYNCSVEFIGSYGDLLDFTGIKSINASNKHMLVYPNPSTNTLTIGNITRKTTIRLYDALGKLILEKEIDSNTSFETSHLAQGIYTLVAKDNKGIAFNKVVITK